MAALLKDKICFVTGAGRGIGRAVAALFVEEGATVYANTKTPGSMDAWSDSLEGRLIPLYFDVTDAAACANAMRRVRKEQGRLDALVNNAGIMRDALIGMVSSSLVQELFAVNVFAVIELLQLGAKLMRPQKRGSIINMSSFAGTQGNTGQLAYSATKGAVSALTKTAARELAAVNIRVNAVAPGMIGTDLFHAIGEEKARERLETIAMGRLGTPEDVAKTCLYLASDMSEYVTGQILGVDGGARA